MTNKEYLEHLRWIEQQIVRHQNRADFHQKEAAKLSAIHNEACHRRTVSLDARMEQFRRSYEPPAEPIVFPPVGKPPKQIIPPR